MVMLIVLAVAVTAGVLSTGTQDGQPSDSAPAPSTDTPDSGAPTVGATPSGSSSEPPDGAPPTQSTAAGSPTSASTPTAEPTGGDFTGVWVGAQGSVLTISSAGTFRAEKDGQLVDSGSVAPSGSRVLLNSDAGADGTMSLTGADTAVVQLQSLAPVTQFTRG